MFSQSKDWQHRHLQSPECGSFQSWYGSYHLERNQETQGCHQTDRLVTREGSSCGHPRPHARHESFLSWFRDISSGDALPRSIGCCAGLSRF